MTGTWVSSHIAGHYAYQFSGDDGVIEHNSSLDITGSFRLGFQVKFDQLFLNGTLWSKSTGALTDATVTSLNIQSVNGYLKVMISDGTKFLVYNTDNRVFATYKAVQIDIVWDNTTKIMKIYKDAVNQPITIDTSSGTYYASPSSMGSILVTSTADLIFGYGAGQSAFKGTLYGAIYNNVAKTGTEVFDYFSGKEDTVSTPPSTTLLLGMRPNGGSPYNIYEMYPDGTGLTLKISSVNTLGEAVYNSDKTKVTYWNATEGQAYTKDFVGLTNIRNSPTKDPSQISPANPAKMITSYYNRTGDGKYRLNFADPTTLDSAQTAISPNHNLSGTYTNEYFPHYNSDASKVVFVLSDNSTNNAIALINGDLDDGAVSSSLFIVHTSTTDIRRPRFSPDNQWILFTKLVGSYYQVFKIKTDGTNLTQLTAEPYTIYQATWSPDGTKIAFNMNNGVGGFFQTHIMNSDGSNIINISNNSNDEWVSDWK